jgi:eukaryotic-like serine/threonine-protein kinase
VIFLPTSGALVASRFRLRHPIGKGGMGQVWEAHDRELDSSCAIKFILDHLARDPDARSRLVREARAVARLRSPHVVTILGVGEHADAMYLAMELLDGETLASRLERTRRLDGITTLAIVEQVVQVLDRAHAHGIVHRDLKPDNIWLSADSPPFIKVLDFGVAKSTLKTGEKQTATGALMGTPHYMSPEQASGDREVDHRSDLWALAVIAMECLSGRRPFESSGLGDLLMKIMQTRPPSAQAMDPNLPAALNLWWQRALAHELDERYPNATELALGLRIALGLTIAPVGASPFAETSRGTWGVAPVARIPTLVTNITPAVPADPAAPPSTHTPSTLAQPLEAQAASPQHASLQQAQPKQPLPLAPTVAAHAIPTLAPLGVDSTQVVDAPPPLTEQMMAGQAPSFPFRPADAGSVGALTQTAAGGAIVAPRRRWWWAAAAAGCAVLALSVTWWRLREPTPAPIADTAPLVEPALGSGLPGAGLPGSGPPGSAPQADTVAHSLRPEGVAARSAVKQLVIPPTGSPPSTATQPSFPAPPAVTLQPVTGPAARPDSSPKAAADAPPTVRPINISPVPATAAAVKKAASPSSELPEERPRRATAPGKSAPSKSASPASGASSKSAPSKSASSKSAAAKTQPGKTQSAKTQPAKSSPPAGESAAELQRRLGF